MLRGITRSFVGIILFFLAVFGLVAGIVTVRLLDANVYKSALQNSGAYEAVADQAQKEVSSLVNTLSLDDKELTLIVRQAIQDELKTRAASLIGVEGIKTIVNKNLDNLGDYINSYSDILNVYLPKSDIRGLLLAGVLNVAKNVDTKIEALPICNGAQPAKDVSELSCVTSGLKQSGGAQLFIKQLLPTTNLDSGELPPGLQFLQGNDQLPLAAYTTQLGIAESSSINQITSALADLRSFISTVKLLILVTLILIVFFFVIYVALKKGGFLTKIKSSLKMVFFIGMGIITISGICLLGISIALSSNVLNDIFPNASFNSYLPILSSAVKDVFGQILIPILLGGAVVTLIAFVAWLITHLLSSLLKTVD